MRAAASGGSAGTPAGLGGTAGHHATGSGGTGVRVDGSVVDAPPPITDFPPGPILGTPTTPTNAPTLFGGTPRNNSAPCIVSPQDGTLMPQNWLRPRFEWKANSDQEPDRDRADRGALPDAAEDLHRRDQLQPRRGAVGRPAPLGERRADHRLDPHDDAVDDGHRAAAAVGRVDGERSRSRPSRRPARSSTGRSRATARRAPAC